MSIILRLNKGSELTYAEVDGNFQSLFYSGSLIGTDLTFYYPSSSLSQSFDLSVIPGFGGVTVQDDGSTIINSATGLNFTGSGVTVTANGSIATVEITGGGGGGDTYTLSAGAKSGVSVPLNLDALAGSDSVVSLTEGTGITLTRNAANQITIDSSGTGGIFEQTGSYYATTNNLQITASGAYQLSTYGNGVTANPNNDGSGGSVAKYSTMFTQSIWHYTDNVGYPTSIAWKTGLAGSVFDRYDQNTDTAEIIRFIATQLSASSPDTVPNTRIYSAISEDIQNSTTATIPAGTVPSVIGNSVVTYLNGQGFAGSGQALFEGVSTRKESNSSYLIRYDSVASGTTVVSSSNDAELFNLGSIGVVFNVSGTERRTYSDNFAQTQTAATSSTAIYTKTGPGTSADGLTIGDIDGGSQPDVYQDGKFVDVLSTALYNGGIPLANQEATGLYTIAASVGIQSGSSVYTDANASSNYTQTETLFFLPSAVTGIVNNTLAQGYYGYKISTATGACVTRSLSSAPYLQEAIWDNSGSVTGLFDPLFSETQYISRLDENNSFTTLAAGAGGDFRASCQNGTVDIANTIYDSTGASARSTGTVPQYNDISKLLGLLSFDCTTSNTATNITETTISPTTYPTYLKGRNRSNSENTIATVNVPFHTAGNFGKTSQMGYYGAGQTYDAGSETGTSENFSGETYRVQITNNALIGTYTGADAWSTAFNLTALGGKDLQVKPGYLVFPGGSRGYYISDPDAGQDYKYYLRAFERSSLSAATSMIINVGKSNLVNWNSTSNGISVAIIFESGGSGNETPPRIYDISNLLQNVVETGIANDDFKNPFSTNIDLYGNTGGGLSGNNYTIPLRGADSMQLDGTNQGYIVMIRYKNDTDPIEDINITIS